MRLALVALAVAVMGNATAQTANPTASDIRRAISHDCAKPTVDNLVSQGRWDGVSDQIAKGQDEWLALVPLLASGTDAGTSEDLGIDLALALPHHADSVLKVANLKRWVEGGIIGIERVCGLPFIEDTQPKGYVRQAIAAVAAVSDPNVSENRRECLKALKQAGSARP